jgi:cell division protein FtsL
MLRRRFVLNQRRITFNFTITILFLFCLLFLHVFQNNRLVALVNEKEELKRFIVRLEKERDSLKQQELNLNSLQRIEFVARERLGMIVPTAANRVYVAETYEDL